MKEARKAFREVFNFFDRWQQLPSSPAEVWEQAVKEMPAIASTPLATDLLIAVWDELERRRAY